MLLIAAFALALFTLFAKLGGFPLGQPDEGRNAEVAREMFESHSWLVPTLDGMAYLDKPAFFFKCAALCYSAFGVSETTARLPSALFAFGAIIVAWAFARRAFGPRVAAMTVAIMATSPLFVALSRIVIMDMTLAFFVIAAIFAGAMAEEFEDGRRTKWLLIGAAAQGCATLVKGPVGFIVPLVVLIPWHLIERRRGAVKRMFGWQPVLVFWAFVLPWFIGLSMARPDFPHYGLIEESFHRFTTGAMKREKPFYFFGIVSFAGFAVWSLVIPWGIAKAWRERARLGRADRLCIVWCVATIIFFSLSKSKQPAYILSITAPVGILIARIFDAAIKQPGGGAARTIRIATGILGAIMIIAGAGISMVPTDTLGRWVTAAPNTMALMMPLIGPLRVALIALGVIGIAGVFLRSALTAFVFFAAILPSLGICGFGNLAAYTAHRSSAEIASSIPKLPPETEIASLQIYQSALPFYLQRQITLITNDGGETGSNYIIYTLKKSPQWPPQMVKASQLGDWLASRTNPVFLVAGRGHTNDLAAIATERGITLTPLAFDFAGALLPPPAK